MAFTAYNNIIDYVWASRSAFVRRVLSHITIDTKRRKKMTDRNNNGEKNQIRKKQRVFGSMNE